MPERERCDRLVLKTKDLSIYVKHGGLNDNNFHLVVDSCSNQPYHHYAFENLTRPQMVKFINKLQREFNAV